MQSYWYLYVTVVLFLLVKPLKTFLCPAAHSEKQRDREDLSHPVHVDNCVLVSEVNECIKEPPAYTHRDYRWARTLRNTVELLLHPRNLYDKHIPNVWCLSFSAILYLNEDFEGGEFIFTELDAKTVTVNMISVNMVVNWESFHSPKCSKKKNLVINNQFFIKWRHGSLTEALCELIYYYLSRTRLEPSVANWETPERLEYEVTVIYTLLDKNLAIKYS